MPETDVLVLGGGPAGCAAATLLARRGHTVTMVRSVAPPAGALAESIPPSARRVLEELGALDAVEAAGFQANRGNSVWWAGRELRREAFGAGVGGFHTDRASLETVLGGVAEAAGVRVHTGVTARGAEEGDGWKVVCDAAEGTVELRARWIVDATGRHGLLARGEREPDRMTTTLALVRRWRRPGGWAGDEAHDTLVESYDDGWAWSVPLSPDVRCITVMIDQRHTDMGGVSLDAMLDAELAQTRHVGPIREGCEPVGGAWACPASLYTSRRFGRAGLLLAGDAGSFIDPLSSFGVKKALSSGWLAAVVAHTSLVDPSMTETAVGFFDRRERDVYRRYREISTDFLVEAAEAHGTEFWSARARAAEAFAQRSAAGPAAMSVGFGGSGSTTPVGSSGFGRTSDDPWHADPPRDPSSDPDRLGPVVPESAVRAAFEEIKARAQLDAVPGRTLTTLERPAVEGQRIVLQRQLASDECPEGIRFVRGVDLLGLVEVAPLHPDVPDGWAAYNGVAAPVTLPDYLTALATAFAAGLLEHEVGGTRG